ncbi:MAG: small multi-drug export protein [Desulfurococcaceae archaeon]
MELWQYALAILMSIMPISEVRGAIPYVVLVAKDTSSVVVGCIISTISNMVVPVIVFNALDLLNKFAKSSDRLSFFKKTYSWIVEHGKKKAHKVEAGGYVALSVFVALPFPATGAWTGSLIAYLLGLDRCKSILFINLGVLIASIIVFSAVYLSVEFLKKIFFIF